MNIQAKPMKIQMRIVETAPGVFKVQGFIRPAPFRRFRKPRWENVIVHCGLPAEYSSVEEAEASYKELIVKRDWKERVAKEFTETR